MDTDYAVFRTNMETGAFENFVKKVIEAELLFKLLTRQDQKKAAVVFLHVCNVFQKILGTESFVWESSTDQQTCDLLEQFYTPKDIVDNILYEVIGEAVSSSTNENRFSQCQESVLSSHNELVLSNYVNTNNDLVLSKKQDFKSSEKKLSMTYETCCESPCGDEKSVYSEDISNCLNVSLSEKQDKKSKKKIKLVISKKNKNKFVVGKKRKQKLKILGKCDDKISFLDKSTIKTEGGDSKTLGISSLNTVNLETEAERNRFCEVCGDRYQTLGELQEHLKTAHPTSKSNVKSKEQFFRCEVCKKFFTTRISLTHHLKSHSEVMFESDTHVRLTCMKCGDTFKKQVSYDKHMKCHEMFDCPVCGRPHQTMNDVKEHYLLEHGQELPTGYTCGVCYKICKRQSELEVHKRIHTGERPIECVPCKLSFRTSKALFKHKQTHSHSLKIGGKATERKFLCSQCGKSYFRKNALQRHLAYHTGEKEFMCQHCGYKCREKTNLRRHMALHFEAERNFVCEVCGAAFHAKKTLETHHSYKHNSARSYSCSQCNESFKAKNSLKRHMKTHSTEKQHKCWCGTGFKCMYNLRRHLKMVHGTDDLLPPVRRVETLDALSKKPSSRTDVREINVVMPVSATTQSRTESSTEGAQSVELDSNVENHMTNNQERRPHMYLQNKPETQSSSETVARLQVPGHMTDPPSQMLIQALQLRCNADSVVPSNTQNGQGAMSSTNVASFYCHSTAPSSQYSSSHIPLETMAYSTILSEYGSNYM